MLLLCFIGVCLVTVGFRCNFSMAVCDHLLGMLSIAFVCFDMLAYSFHGGTRLMWFLISCSHLLTIVFCFLERGGFCIRFVIGCCCLFPFCSVGSCVSLHRLLLGSEFTVVFVGRVM